MSGVFDQAFQIVIGAEGGYSNDSRDPGGETRYGISKRSYPAVDIANLTLDQAKAIYFRDYWTTAGCDKLTDSLAIIVFDSAVNSGPGQAVRWLQAAAGVPQDGAIGPVTLAAVARMKPEQAAVDSLAARLLFMASLPTWPTFRLGWTRRLFGLIGAAFEGANTTVTIAPAEPPEEAVTIPNIEAAVRRVLTETRSAA